MWRKVFSLIITLSLVFQQVGFASMAAELNLAGHLSKMSSGMAVDRFRPVHIRFFSFDMLNDNIKVMLDKGSLKAITKGELSLSTQELLNYFLVGLTLPNDTFWVNLRPDSENEIIDDWLAKTDVGKIMLEADLQLKKDTARFTSPETTEGRAYWTKLYQKAEELYGYQEVTIPTLTRPWIVPGEIIVRETKDSSYIYKATLKVMLEQDVLKGSDVYSFKDERSKALNEYSSQLIRELIIPKLTTEINLSKRYSALRQVYYSLIFSRWFKSRFSNQTGKYVSLIDRKDLTGLTSISSWSKTSFFDAYKKSFAQGEYNVKETVRTPTGQVIRSYFSGGVLGTDAAFNEVTRRVILKERQISGPSTDRVDTLIPALKNILDEASGTPTTHEKTVGEVKAGSPITRVAINNPGAPERELIRQWLESKLADGIKGKIRQWIISKLGRPEVNKREIKDFTLVGVNGISPTDLHKLLTRDFSAAPETRDWFKANFKVLAEGLGDKNGKLVLPVTEITNPQDFPWQKWNTEVVYEGKKANLALIHKELGAERVIVSHPALVAATSLIPVISALQGKAKIKGIDFEDIQPPSYLQRLLDNSSDDPITARAAALNLATLFARDCEEYLQKIFPALDGKIVGKITTSPQVLGSIMDIRILVDEETNPKKINEIFKAAAGGALKGKLKYSEDPSLVASDSYQQPEMVFLAKQTKVTGRLVHIQILHNEETTFAATNFPMLLDMQNKGQIPAVITSKDSENISNEADGVLASIIEKQSTLERPQFLDVNFNYIPSLDGKTMPKIRVPNKSEMLPARVGINGPGRTGRTMIWAWQGDPNLDIRMINGSANSLILAWLLGEDSVQLATPKPITRIIVTPGQLRKEITMLLGAYSAEHVKGLLTGLLTSERLVVLEENDEFNPYLGMLLTKWGTPKDELQSAIERLKKSLVGILDLNGKKVLQVNERRAVSELPWDIVNAEFIAESTGDLKNADEAKQHLTRLKKGKVWITAPAEGAGDSMVLGVKRLPNRSAIVKDNASCTTNCLMPMVAVLEKFFGIAFQEMLTAHGYTTDQSREESIHKKEEARGRLFKTAIPSSTGAATKAKDIYPFLAGNSDGWAVRTVNPTGSKVVLTVMVHGRVTKEQVQAAYEHASKNELAGIMAYTLAPIVSTSILGNPASTILDGNSIKVIDYDEDRDLTMLSVDGWYDNETGFSTRMGNVIVADKLLSMVKARIPGDIGPETVKLFESKMKEVLGPLGEGTVLWNGPMGIAEAEATRGGTTGIARAILGLGKKVIKVTGGGDTLAQLTEDEQNKFNRASTGGGAFLESFKFGVENLPGIKVIINPATGDLSDLDKMLESVKEGDRVFLRIDGNVPLDSGLNVTDNLRLRAVLPTIQKLLAKKAKIIMGTHLGRPNGKQVAELKTDPVAEELQRLLQGVTTVHKLDDCIGQPIKDFINNQQKAGEIVFLENFRFRLAEEQNNADFAKELSQLADFYINDAFPVDHRAHASVEAITKFFAPEKMAAGMLLQKEYQYLKQLRENPQKPLIVVLGGGKVDTKIDLINALKKDAALFLIGGRMALAFLAAQGKKIGDSTPDANDVAIAKKLLADPDLAGKIVLQIDSVVVSDTSGSDAEVVVGEIEPSDVSEYEKVFYDYIRAYAPRISAEARALAHSESMVISKDVPPSVTSMIARLSTDSRGQDTIEYEVGLEKDGRKYTGKAKIPAGASTGEREVWINPDFVKTANEVVAPRLFMAIEAGDVDITGQKSLAIWLKNLDRELGGSARLEKIGGNVVLAVCWAFADAVAQAKGLPLYQYWIQEYGEGSLPYSPKATYNILNAGAHGSATTKVDTQETQFGFLGNLNAAQQNALAKDVNNAMKNMLQKKGLNTNNGDEGGYSPAATSNMQYVLYMIEAIQSIKNGPVLGKDIALAFDFASTGFFKDGIYYLRGESGPINLLKDLGPAGEAYFKKLVEQGVLGSTTIGEATIGVQYKDKWKENEPGIKLQRREWLAYVQYMMLRAPAMSLEDVCAENDWASIREMTRLLEEDRDFYEARVLEHKDTGFYNGRRVWHILDDSTTSNPDYALLALLGSENAEFFTRIDNENIKVNNTGVTINLKELGATVIEGKYIVEPYTANAFLLKFNQIGTPEDTFSAAKQALIRGASAQFSHRSGSAFDRQFIHGAYVATTFEHNVSTNPNILPELKDVLPEVFIKAGNITRERVIYHDEREEVERSFSRIQEKKIRAVAAASSAMEAQSSSPLEMRLTHDYLTSLLAGRNPITGNTFRFSPPGDFKGFTLDSWGTARLVEIIPSQANNVPDKVIFYRPVRNSVEWAGAARFTIFVDPDGRVRTDIHQDFIKGQEREFYAKVMKVLEDIKIGKNSQEVVEKLFMSGAASSAVDAQVIQSSSPANAGGIDFRPAAMPISYQAMGNFANLNLDLPKLSQEELARFDVDKELAGLETMVEREILPSGERIKEVIAVSSQKGEMEFNRERVMALLVKVGILEETQCCLQEASEGYKEALVLADSLS